jgi:hypothetical protein
MDYTWSWAARPGRPDPTRPENLGQAGLVLHVGSGSGLNLEPKRRAGPNSSLQETWFWLSSGQAFARSDRAEA